MSLEEQCLDLSTVRRAGAARARLPVRLLAVGRAVAQDAQRAEAERGQGAERRAQAGVRPRVRDREVPQGGVLERAGGAGAHVSGACGFRKRCSLVEFTVWIADDNYGVTIAAMYAHSKN